MSGDLKYIDLQEFVDLGFVQEINRQVLHPAGLAMSYSVDGDGSALAITDIWDDREDVEGIVFGKIDKAKAESVAAIQYAHLEGRRAFFGDATSYHRHGPALIQDGDLGDG